MTAARPTTDSRYPPLRMPPPAAQPGCTAASSPPPSDRRTAVAASKSGSSSFCGTTARVPGWLSMKYTHLGRSGLSVSRLCLGTMNFGWKTEEADAHTIMDRALAEGVNFFDTANVYGFDAGKGRTEEVLGAWFAQGGERRDKTVLATKVYGGVSDWPNDTFLSARNIVRACEASLRRLQTDWIDLYHIHHVDLATPWDEIWQACETLVAQGKVLYIGSSNHAGWQIAAANEAAGRRHFQGLGREEALYKPLTR